MGQNPKRNVIIIPSLFGFSTLKVSPGRAPGAKVSRSLPGETSAPGRNGQKLPSPLSINPGKTFIGNVSLTPSALHIYQVPEGGFNRSQRFQENQVHLRNNKHNGELSDKAARRIKNAIEWLLIRSKPQRVFNRHQEKTFFFRLNFITLTLPAPQRHPDKEITSRCLGNFLNILRNRFGVTDYLWKAEAQGNGNIHFHITTNTFIHWRDVRSAWCSSVELLGYVSEFKAKFHHRNPPCTEIRKVKHIRKLAGYLSKYLAKNKSFAPIGELREINGKRFEILYSSKAYRDEKRCQKVGRVVGTVLSERVRKIESNLWGCSQSISKVKPMHFDESSIQWPAIRALSFFPGLKRIPGDHVDSYFGSVLKAAAAVSPGLYEDMVAHANFREVSERFTDDKVLQYLE